MLAHCAMLSAAMTGRSAESLSEITAYRLQILHLKPAIRSEKISAEALSKILHSLSRPNRAPAADAAGQDSPRASQTLMVAAAPPNVALKKAIPLPMIIAWKPLDQIPISVDPPRTRLTVAPLSRVPDSPAGPTLISLPEPAEYAPDALILPKVNQRATAGDSDTEPEAPADLPGSPEKASTIVGANGVLEAPPITSSDFPSAADVALRLRGTHGVDAPTGPNVPNAADAQLIRIELPPESKPRSAILGESPQMAGRIVSTVYLKSGLRKNWMLEYWSQESSVGLEPPWPYTMLLPNLTFPADSDALLVRGRLNAEGRLEQLAMLAPTHSKQMDSLFHVLEQWHFRAASKNGIALAVEILLVIPRQVDE
ncbi:MAG: hypothetical protein JWN34_3740 [Bryobacterales bacterium]|nr:hypothetical protein [Bryobacterales bacterium]